MSDLRDNPYAGARLFVIHDSSNLAIFYSYKICKQCNAYSSNLHSSFNIHVNSLEK